MVIPNDLVVFKDFDGGAAANRSWVNFPVGYVRFFLKDRRILKRQVLQEKEIIPVYVDPLREINGKERIEMVYGFEPFAVPKGQRFIVQVAEKGEGRFIELPVNSRIVSRARPLRVRLNRSSK